MSSLHGKNAIITGSTSGIGEGIAKRMAAAGCNITLNGFGDAAEIEALRAAMEKDYGVRVIYNGADLTSHDDVKGLIDQTRETFGSVDILINNAGIQHVDTVENFPPEKWEKIIALNLSAAFYTTRLVVEDMKKQGYGRIINIASAHGLRASKGKAAYVAAKHGIVGLTKVVGLELAGTGATCNAICPGWVLTPLVQKQIDANAARDGISVAEAEKELLAEKQPSLQFATPDQIGGLAVFLCSDDAAQITGTTQSIDGGWTAK
jgi:3-hydroxybutyrate dehydrogenase